LAVYADSSSFLQIEEDSVKQLYEKLGVLFSVAAFLACIQSAQLGIPEQLENPPDGVEVYLLAAAG
jgi:hypothetical protein